MGSRVLQHSFLGGEISPAMLGRLDNGMYQQGACKIQNFIVEPTGALLSRPGFRYVTKVRDNGACRLIPFRFSSDQTLVLVFTDKKLRIVTEGKELLTEEGDVYEIDSPYSGEDLFDLDYSQTADIITITSSKYPPMELQRHGATDWRFVTVTTMPSITPPSTVTAIANYPNDTDAKDKNIITVRYKVTAIDADGKESVGSEPKSLLCNYYLTGGSNTISWSAVEGAVRYRVYRDVAGIFGFLGETEGLTIEDQGDFSPDTTTTPPIYDNPFLDKTGIKAVEVLDGGSGYPDVDEALSSASPSRLDLKLPFLHVGVGNKIISTGLPDSFNVDYNMVNGLTGSILATCTIKYVLAADKAKSYRGTTALSGLYLPENFAESEGLTRLNFTAYSGENVCLKATWPDRQASPLQIFSDASVTVSGSYTTGTGTSGSAGTTHTYTVTVDPLPFQDMGLHNGMTKQLFGKVAGWRLNSNTAGIFVLGGNGAPIADVLKETGETLDGIIEENSVQIEIDDPTGTGAVLQAIVEGGKITAVNVISSGVNYTEPKLTVVSKKGSGARLKATLFDEQDFDYPAANTQYDQRRIFAGTLSNPLKVWMTNAGQQDLMMYHFPVLADDRIELTAVTADADMIRHAVALDSLLLFTGSGELRVFTQNSDALAPDSVAVRAQSYIGANNVQPVIANSVVLFAAARGGHMRSVQYTYTTSGYACTDLSMGASHLFDGLTIKDLALMKSPAQIVWAVSSNGKLLGLTFTPDQNIAAWHQHQTDGRFLSVCVVTEGEEDHLYAVVEREINGQAMRYIERMDKIVVTDEKDARQLDCFIDNQGVSLETPELTGLEHLEGKQVKVFADGKDLGLYTVQDGRVPVDVQAEQIAVGLPYTATLITIPLAANAQGSLQGSVKNVGEIFLRVRHSGDIWANVYPKQKLYLCKRDDREFAQQSQESKIVRLSADGVWDYQGQMQVEHRNCIPLEIQALIGNVNVEGVR